MMEHGYWDINGHTHVYLGSDAAAMHAWAMMLDDTERRTVAINEVNNIFVSTVFIGTDHDYGEGPPLLFETMTFFHDGGDARYDQIVWRYPTWDEAYSGHLELCEVIRSNSTVPKASLYSDE